MQRFYLILESNDLRHLIDCDELPENASDNLKLVWDAIMREYQNLTHRQDYSMSIRKFTSDLEKHNRLNGLISCYHLLRYGINCSDQLKHWGLNSNNIQALELKILQEKTKLNIELVQKQNKVEPKEDFDKLVVLVENSLNRNIDVEKISVKKWVYLCKSIEDKAHQIEKLNGRQNNRPRPN